MSTQVVVLGAGYAGAGAVKRLERELDDDAELTWVSEHDYHLVLHESHRCISDPTVQSKISVPVEDIATRSTNFVQGRVAGIDVDERTVSLEEGTEVAYDYLLIALGSTTAFYGIEGLREHAHTLKGLDDALAIHEDVLSVTERASPAAPAQAVVGGAGLSGIQVAGELAELRDERDLPLEITLVEGLDEVFPGSDPELQDALRRRLDDRDIEVLTGEFVSRVGEDVVYVGGGEDSEPATLPYDVFVWTGGITGQPELADAGVDKDPRSNRIYATSTFRTSDERVFAIGDTALVEQGHDEIAPPTAQAAWQAAKVAGDNVVRALSGEPLKTWSHEDMGTVVSIGEDAVAHDVKGVPVETFGGVPARLLKKGIAARWLADVSSVRRAIRAWPDM
jgi:NADH dehydrogenase